MAEWGAKELGIRVRGPSAPAGHARDHGSFVPIKRMLSGDILVRV